MEAMIFDCNLFDMTTILARFMLIFAQITLFVTLFVYDLESDHLPGQRSGIALLASSAMIIMAEANRIIVEVVKEPIGLDIPTTIVLLAFSMTTQAIIITRMIINIHNWHHKHKQEFVENAYDNTILQEELVNEEILTCIKCGAGNAPFVDRCSCTPLPAPVITCGGN